MGLPVWRAPSPETKDALKVDPTAPARSPIRRRSPFISRRARSARSPPSPRLFDGNLLFSTSTSGLVPADVSRPPSSRPRLPPPPVPEPRNYSWNGDPARSTSALQRIEDNRMMRLDRRLERYYRSAFEASTLGFGGFGEISRNSRPLPALTPNFAPAAASRDSRERSVEERHRTSLRRGPPHFRVSVSPGRNVFWTSSVHNNDTFEDDEDNADNNAVGFPPLRRMGRRQIADGPLPSSSLRESWSPATTLDGLGDRERSISPVDDHWDNLLSTVAPDPLPPTADSSFTSAAASASFSDSHPSSRAGSSNSNSASSSRTHLTVPSRHDSPPNELFMRACESSESDTASDTEDDDDIQPEMYSLRRRSQRGSANGPPPQNPQRYSHGVRDRSRHASAYVRGLFDRDDTPQQRERTIDQFDGPAEEMNTGDDEMQTLDQDLRDARAILERLARREDIADEHWASIGLTRFLADRVERIQQRERL